MSIDINPDKIGFTGDWHGNTHYAVRAIEYAAERGADVIVQLGDFGYMGKSVPRYLDALDAALEAHQSTLYWLDGNHENHPRISELDYAPDGTHQLTERIFHLPRGYRWTWRGVSFVALGGAHSVDRQMRTPMFNWWEGETVTLAQAFQVIEGGEADVMLTHDAPAGWDIPGLNNTGFPESELWSAAAHRELLAMVAKHVRPRALFHGHFHRRYSLASAPVRPQLSAPVAHRITSVEGLDCDGGPLSNNVMVKNISELM